MQIYEIYESLYETFKKNTFLFILIFQSDFKGIAMKIKDLRPDETSAQMNDFFIYRTLSPYSK